MQTRVMPLIRDRKRAPRDDLLTELARVAGMSEQSMDPLEQLAFITDDLFVTGSALVAAALSHGALLLAQDADLADRLRANLSLVPSFAEEALRLASPVRASPRYVRQDTTLAGVRLAKADTLLLQFGEANRDEKRFEQASRVDLLRPQPGKHLAFGLGRHFCIGAALARNELIVAFNALLGRFDRFSLTPQAGPLQYVPSITARLLRELPLTVSQPTARSPQP
jgi:cytochrome P450